MKTVRFNTFETNSSSCHSVTVFKNPEDWKDFKNNKTGLRRIMYDIEEHSECVNIISDENRDEYIVDLKDLYNSMKEGVDNMTSPLRGSTYVSYNDKDNFIASYLKEHLDFSLMMKILTGGSMDIICVPPKPIVLRYSHYDDVKTYTYDSLTVSDFYEFIFGYGRFFGDLPRFYVYGDECSNAGWTNAEVKELIDKNTGEEITVVIRNEEC